MKNIPKKLISFLFSSLILLLFTINPSSAQTVDQTITLTPGWNAVFLEVEPEQNQCDDVFAGLPVLSVWWWNPRTDTVEYIQDPNTLMPDQPQWMVYFPPSTPESILTNLHTVRGGMPYLINLDGSESVTWTLSGRPCLPEIDWKPNSYNLVGFYLEPGNEPFFQAFLDSSPALKNQEINYLNSSGNWELVTDPATTRMKNGEAFWIYCNGTSDFIGTLSVRVAHGDGIDFGTSLVEENISIRNCSGADATVSLDLSGDINLSYWKYEPEINEAGWIPFPAGFSLGVNAGKEEPLRFSVNRYGIEPDVQVHSILEIKNNEGMRIVIPVSTVGNDKVGLWVGHALINKVNAPQINKDTPNEAVSTGSEAQFRLIVHVDTGGTVRLLREVTQMWDTDEKKYVLVTNDDRIPGYIGPGLRDGRNVGRRVSSAVFSFPGPLLMTGSFSAGSQITAGYQINGTDSINPFRHKYHPDHETGLDITRNITMTFTQDDPTNLSLSVAGWGDTYMGGTYKEVIDGLHQESIIAEGLFRLHKVSDIGELMN